jgi:hypothetical protein
MAIIRLDVDESLFVRSHPGDIIERARNRTARHHDRLALEAFEAGEKYIPPKFGIGLAAGNYRTNLVSRDGRLYYVRRMPSSYRQQLVAIAENEETARIAAMREAVR